MISILNVDLRPEACVVLLDNESSCYFRDDQMEIPEEGKRVRPIVEEDQEARQHQPLDQIKRTFRYYLV